MPDEPQNPIPTENSIPVSPQEPTVDAPIPPSTSESVAMPPEAPESPTQAESAVPVNVDNEPSSPENGQIEPTAETVNQASNEPVSVTPDMATAQIPVNEPFASKPDSEPKPNTARNLWNKALSAIQIRKRKKLDKIMILFLKQSKISNDEVEKLLHVSDATATRYLSILEKEGKIKQSGRTGQSVSYSRM